MSLETWRWDYKDPGFILCINCSAFRHCMLVSFKFNEDLNSSPQYIVEDSHKLFNYIT